MQAYDQVLYNSEVRGCRLSRVSMAFSCTMAHPVCFPARQVYKGLRGGIQDVAVKVLFDADEAALSRFIKVCPGGRSQSLSCHNTCCMQISLTIG